MVRPISTTVDGMETTVVPSARGEMVERMAVVGRAAAREVAERVAVKAEGTAAA